MCMRTWWVLRKRVRCNSRALFQHPIQSTYNWLIQPWPLIPQFLATLEPGSIGADLGCGNGKYLHLRSAFGVGPDASVVTLGSDRCEPLVQDAQHNFPDGHYSRLHETAIADALHSQLRTAAFVRERLTLGLRDQHRDNPPFRDARAAYASRAGDDSYRASCAA